MNMLSISRHQTESFDSITSLQKIYILTAIFRLCLFLHSLLICIFNISLGWLNGSAKKVMNEVTFHKRVHLVDDNKCVEK